MDKMKAGDSPVDEPLGNSKLLGHLKCETVAELEAACYRNTRLLASGSAFDLAIVESLTELNETKTLAPHDRQTLERAAVDLLDRRSVGREQKRCRGTNR